MKQNILFYSFVIIFIITAIITLLGIVNVLTIKPGYLNALLGAFIVELGAAVIALFKKTDFFSIQNIDVMDSLDYSAKIIDEISGQILMVINGSNQQPDDYAHRMLIKKEGNEIVAYRRQNTITKEDIEKLPDNIKNHIKIHEIALTKLYKIWSKLIIKRIGNDGSIDDKIENQLKEIVKKMKQHLLAILNFLKNQGIYLDDHYQAVRETISEFN